MHIIINTFLLILISISISACSEEADKVSGSGKHVWKEQTDTIDKARNVENEILNAADSARKTIEEQTDY